MSAESTPVSSTFEEASGSVTPSNESFTGERPTDRVSLPPWDRGDVLVGRYHVEDLLGGPDRSGMGIVYLVSDPQSKETFAAKTIKSMYLKRPRAMKRFEREARLWMELGKHPNIVQAHFFEWIDERPVLFLEYIEGGDLAGLMRDRPFAIRQSLRFMVHFCRGMVHARANIPGFIHRDIKPANCLLTPGDVLKVTDFGLACAIGSDDDDPGTIEPGEELKPVPIGEPGSATIKGLVAGTLPYMPPEMFLKPPIIEARSDIYAFGIMLYRMLTGHYPLKGKTYEEWASQHATAVVPPPVTLNSRVHPPLDELVMQCISKDPADRPAHFDEVLERLESTLLRFHNEELPVPDREGLEAEALRRKGMTLSRLGEQDDAMRSLEMAIDLAPGYAPALLDCARIHAKAGRAAQALEDTDRVLKLAPGNVDALLFKSSLLMAGGRLEEALDCCEQALSSDVRSVESWLARSRLLERMMDPVHALAGYDRVTRMAPELASGWVGKGHLLVQMGTLDEGLKMIEKALMIDRNIAGAWRARAVALSKQGHQMRALRSIDKAIAISGNDSESWRTRGEILLADGKIKDAIAAFDRGLGADSDNHALWNELGIAHMAIGAMSDAVTSFDNAIARDQMEPLYHVNRARALQRLGKRDEAQESIATARELEPGIRAYISRFADLGDLLDAQSAAHSS